jgi:hypothetical protein
MTTIGKIERETDIHGYYRVTQIEDDVESGPHLERCREGLGFGPQIGNGEPPLICPISVVER